MTGEQPLLVLRTVVQEPARCTFDARVHGCRAGGVP
jgi:hypothetical protein